MKYFEIFVHLKQNSISITSNIVVLLGLYECDTNFFFLNKDEEEHVEFKERRTESTHTYTNKSDIHKNTTRSEKTAPKNCCLQIPIKYQTIQSTIPIAGLLRVRVSMTQ